MEVKNCCSRVLSTSGCPFGESCHFLHYVPGGLSSLGLSPVVSLPATSATAAQRKQLGPIGNPSAAVGGFKTRLCNRYNTPEGCRFGDKCHFAHGESDLRSPNNQSRGNIRRGPVEGPRGTGPPGFNDGSSSFSNSDTFGNSDFNSQGYGEQNPTGVAVNDGSANYAAGPVGENVQVY
ncbi:zinc finger CCCH domain-containing protein 44-like [Macadamia integrifolia]|uniref:zinc finger CCCH domain-containing protein 44-like n=1 Tax=Macadamia integrifolia TaxID=60698 RepID=UPI001C4EA3C5|nr:zinc finger CCCH domain-containing protein 44-like [Macadamia integrifolia]